MTNIGYLFIIVCLSDLTSKRVNTAKSGPINDYIRVGRACQKSSRISTHAAYNLMRFKMNPDDKSTYIDFHVCMFKSLGVFDENGVAPSELDLIEAKIPPQYQEKVSIIYV